MSRSKTDEKCGETLGWERGRTGRANIAHQASSSSRGSSRAIGNNIWPPDGYINRRIVYGKMPQSTVVIHTYIHTTYIHTQHPGKRHQSSRLLAKPPSPVPQSSSKPKDYLHTRSGSVLSIKFALAVATSSSPGSTRTGVT